MSMKLFKFGFVVTVTLITQISCAGADENRCEELAAALLTPLPAVNVVKKTEAELERAQKIRPCLKTYPWPKGVFFTDTEEERAITTDELRKLQNRVSQMIRDHRASPQSTLLLWDSEDSDWTEKQFAYRTLEGWDHRLLDRFGNLLLILRLLPEGNYEEAMRRVDLVHRRVVRARHSPWDIADENTYFSRDAQDHLFVLLKYLILAKTGTATRAEAVKTAEEFAKVRPLLADAISFLEDPASDLLAFTGCSD